MFFKCDLVVVAVNFAFVSRAIDIITSTLVTPTGKNFTVSCLYFACNAAIFESVDYVWHSVVFVRNIIIYKISV